MTVRVLPHVKSVIQHPRLARMEWSFFCYHILWGFCHWIRLPVSNHWIFDYSGAATHYDSAASFLRPTCEVQLAIRVTLQMTSQARHASTCIPDIFASLVCQFYVSGVIQDVYVAHIASLSPTLSARFKCPLQHSSTSSCLHPSASSSFWFEFWSSAEASQRGESLVQWKGVLIYSNDNSP